MPRHEYHSNAIADEAANVATSREAHLYQQVTYLENALNKLVSSDSKEKRAKIAASAARIVNAIFVANGLSAEVSTPAAEAAPF